jgi:hypothetical protein
VLSERYGLDAQPDVESIALHRLTFAELAERFAITREGVRTREHRALQKLTDPMTGTCRGHLRSLERTLEYLVARAGGVISLPALALDLVEWVPAGTTLADRACFLVCEISDRFVSLERGAVYGLVTAPLASYKQVLAEARDLWDRQMRVTDEEPSAGMVAASLASIGVGVGADFVRACLRTAPEFDVESDRYRIPGRPRRQPAVRDTRRTAPDTAEGITSVTEVIPAELVPAPSSVVAMGRGSLPADEPLIFAGLASVTDGPPLEAVASVVSAALRPLAAPRSLAETRPSEADFAWLRDWTATRGSATIRDWLERRPSRRVELGDESATAREACGLVMLLLAAEAARRDAREGEVWPAVRRALPEHLQSLLLPGGQPSFACKSALEEAARRFDLRHVFDLTGTQNWYVTVYLQFGFSRSGIRRLSWWLAGGFASESIRFLTDSQDGSDSFRLLWRQLRAYRSRNLTEQRLRDTLAESPWVLPDWTDPILEEARARIERPDHVGVAGEDVPLVTRPALRWDPPDDPKLQIRVVNLAALDLCAPDYELRVGPECAATLRRQPDGEYEYPDEISVPFGPAQLFVSLVAPDGAVAAAMEYSLWDAAEDVNVFDLRSGAPVDGWEGRLDPRGRYALLIASDLDVLPEPERWHGVDSGHRLCLIRGEELHATCVLLHGETLWEPLMSNAPPRPPEPEWIRQIDVTVPGGANLRFGAKLQLRVFGVPEDAQLEWARVAGIGVELAPDGGGNLSLSATVPPVPGVCRVPVRLGVRRNGEATRVRRALSLQPFGALFLGRSGWKPLPSDAALSTAVANRTLFRVVPPSRRDSPIQDWALVEGSHFVGSPSRFARTLGGLEGLGAPLVLRPGAYNPVDRPEPLARSVVDNGEVCTARWELDEGTLILRLRRSIEPASGHALVLWTPGRPVCRLDWDVVEFDDAAGAGCFWRVSVPHQEVAATLGVSYGGERLGAWWDMERLTEPLANAVACGGDVGECAALLRWLRAPVLNEHLRKALAGALAAAAPMFFRAWLSTAGLPPGLRHAEGDEERWLHAVRVLFHEWQPSDPDTARDALAALGAAVCGEDYTEELDALTGKHTDLARVLGPAHAALGLLLDSATSAAALVALARVSPLLGGRLLTVVVSAADPATRREMRGQMEQTGRRQAVAGWRTGGGEPLSIIAERSMGADEFFFRRLADRVLSALDGTSLDSVDAQNLLIAERATSFRDYLAFRVVERLLTLMGERR